MTGDESWREGSKSCRTTFKRWPLPMDGPPVQDPDKKPEQMVRNVVVHYANGVYVACGEGFSKDMNTTNDPTKVTCKQCKAYG